MLRVSYIPGTGTGRQGSAPYPASERPPKATKYLKQLSNPNLHWTADDESVAKVYSSGPEQAFAYRMKFRL